MFILLYKYKKIKWQITKIHLLFFNIFCGKYYPALLAQIKAW